MNHASLCFLSYQRPASLITALSTALASPGYPCEVIVHDDGSEPAIQAAIAKAANQYASVSLFSRSGRNEGVGRAINRSFSVATGKYLVKLDQDLVFEPNWLIRAIKIVEADPSVGMVGFFKYNYDPVDWRKMNPVHATVAGQLYSYVDDFVSSAFLITRDTYETLGPLEEHSAAFAEDIEYKDRIKNVLGLKLALLEPDACRNTGFGIGPSTVVTSDGTVQSIYAGPWLT